jgi:hypothetical protein
MEALSSSETSVNLYRIKLHYIQEDSRAYLNSPVLTFLGPFDGLENKGKSIPVTGRGGP